MVLMLIDKVIVLVFIVVDSSVIDRKLGSLRLFAKRKRLRMIFCTEGDVPLKSKTSVR